MYVCVLCVGVWVWVYTHARYLHRVHTIGEDSTVNPVNRPTVFVNGLETDAITRQQYDPSAGVHLLLHPHNAFVPYDGSQTDNNQAHFDVMIHKSWTPWLQGCGLFPSS